MVSTGRRYERRRPGREDLRSGQPGHLAELLKVGVDGGRVGRSSAVVLDPAEQDVALGVGVDGLGVGDGEPEVARLDETSTEVRVEVVSTIHPDGDSCADGIQVDLGSPLGDRDVIDLGGSGRMNVSTR